MNNARYSIHFCEWEQANAHSIGAYSSSRDCLRLACIMTCYNRLTRETSTCVISYLKKIYGGLFHKMLKSYRHVGLALIVSYLILPCSESGAQSRSSHDDQTANRAAKHVAPPATSAQSPAYDYPYNCNKPKSAEQDGLCINKRAADAAVESADWAKATFWMGVVGTIAIALTLGANAWAAYEANRSVKVSRSTGEAQVRAYFKPAAIKFDFNSTVTRDEGAVVSAIWENIGQSPALNCVTYVSFSEPLGEQNMGPIAEADIFKAVAVSHDSIAPGETIIRGICNITGEDFRALYAHEKEVIFLTIVSYEDVFGKKFTHSSCSAPVFPKGRDGPIPFRAYPHHNSYKKH